MTPEEENFMNAFADSQAAGELIEKALKQLDIAIGETILHYKGEMRYSKAMALFLEADRLATLIEQMVVETTDYPEEQGEDPSDG